MTNKMIELCFVIFMNIVSLDVSYHMSLVTPNSKLYSHLESQITKQMSSYQD